VIGLEAGKYLPDPKATRATGKPTWKHATDDADYDGAEYSFRECPRVPYRLPKILNIDTEILKNCNRYSRIISKQAEEDVLRANILMSQRFCFFARHRENSSYSLREVVAVHPAFKIPLIKNRGESELVEVTAGSARNRLAVAAAEADARVFAQQVTASLEKEQIQESDERRETIHRETSRCCPNRLHHPEIPYPLNRGHERSPIDASPCRAPSLPLPPPDPH
jgi:hypothetical protein